jgi:hypothetical protein
MAGMDPPRNVIYYNPREWYLVSITICLTPTSPTPHKQPIGTQKQPLQRRVTRISMVWFCRN